MRYVILTNKFTVKRVEGAASKILRIDADPQQVMPLIVEDAINSVALNNFNRESREFAFNLMAQLQGLEEQPFPMSAWLYDREYGIDRYCPPADDEEAENHGQSGLRSIFDPAVARLPTSHLRYEIWPNESQHRGRPHCKVSKAEKSAIFSIPDGERLVGDINPYEREASRTIRRYGMRLLEVWYRLRPDDQRL